MLVKENHDEIKSKWNKLWLAISSWKLGFRENIPFRTAAKLCLHYCDETFVGNFVRRSSTGLLSIHCGLETYEDAMLRYYYATFAATEFPVYSRKWNKGRWMLRMYGGDLMRVVDAYSFNRESTKWMDAYVNRKDLYVHICYLRSIFTQEQL